MKKIYLAILLFVIAVSSFAQTSLPRYELITVSGTNTYTATISPTPAIQNGLKVAVRFTNANSGTSTFNLNSTGAVTLRKADGTALSSGDIPAGSDWWIVYDGTATQWRLIGGSGGGIVTKEYGVYLSDLQTEIVSGTTKAYFRIPKAFTVTAVRASLLTAQTSGSILTIDINENGTTILSTKLTLDNTEKTSLTAATPAVISDTSLADDSIITFDIDSAGVGGVGLVVWIIGY